MPIDFTKFATTQSADTVTNPRDLFSVLPAKQSKYQYPRDVQAEVWQQWFERRNEPEVVLKMNTGGGKTVVGLVILKSCLNEGTGPAVYVAPDPYLVTQVMGEARALGLEATDDPSSMRFQRGKAILVTSIYRLVNGQSVFGVGEEGIKIRIGSLVVDDAHACLASTEGQFTMRLSGEPYTQLFQLFRDDLYEQSSSLALEVEQQEPYKEMLVPYWAWIDKSNQVEQILFSHRKAQDLIFTWPLLKSCLKFCHCAFGRGTVEIAPHVLPISSIPSIAGAKRRIFMSATLADDSVLISHFDVGADAAGKAVTPSVANDIGDRMILVPQELNPSVTDGDIKTFVAGFAQRHNVVVLVPSNYRAKFWQEVASTTLTADNLEAGINALKNGHVGLAVIVNRYDGIDLPHDACRLLVIDGLPDVRRMVDKIEEGVLQGSDFILTQRIQKIEQGMGRGVRSSDDHCVVLLMGSTLTNFLYTGDAQSKFTAATHNQLKLSEQLADQLHQKPLTDVAGAMEYCLSRNPNWISASRGVLVGIGYGGATPLNAHVKARRRAFDAASVNNHLAAIDALQEAANTATDPVTKGWAKAHLAEYLHHVNPVDSQTTLKSAVTLNSRVIHPIAGIVYEKLVPSNLSQSQQCATFINERYPQGNRLILAVNALLGNLVFQPDTAPTFEEAIKQLALFLGFHSQRPETEFRKGPDDLWELGGLQYFVIECKNGATTDTIPKHDCNQLNGSVNWFSEKYDASCKATPILIHPSTMFEYACSPHEATRIITRAKLDELTDGVRSFFEAVVQGEKRDAFSLAPLLDHYHLTPSKFLARYSVPFEVKLF